MARETYCPGLGSPGHGGACPHGRLPLEAWGAWTRDGHVALEVAPASRGPGGTGSPDGPRRLSERFLIWFEPPSTGFGSLTPLADGGGWALVRREMGQTQRLSSEWPPSVGGDVDFGRVLVTPKLCPGWDLTKGGVLTAHIQSGKKRGWWGGGGGGGLSGKISRALGRC